MPQYTEAEYTFLRKAALVMKEFFMTAESERAQNEGLVLQDLKDFIHEDLDEV